MDPCSAVQCGKGQFSSLLAYQLGHSLDPPTKATELLPGAAKARASMQALAGSKAFPIAYAMRRALRKGYSAQDFRADVLAGVVVGIVALPLSMALAIAVGAPPQHGLYTAIFAGITVSLLGGCKFQVTGDR